MGILKIFKKENQPTWLDGLKMAEAFIDEYSFCTKEEKIKLINIVASNLPFNIKSFDSGWSDYFSFIAIEKTPFKKIELKFLQLEVKNTYQKIILS